MRLPSILALALYCAVTPFVHAWGGDGHQLTALIAEAHLTPAAKTAIHDLLGKDRDGGQAEISDAEVASWADQVKRERKESGPWHYVDIPYEAAGYDATRDGNNGDNIIDKIVSFAEILRNPAKPKAERAEALKWVVHFVGDLHQPLHCAERDKDRGGNSRLAFLLEAKGKASNLHSIWDTGLLKLIVDKRPIAEVGKQMDQKIKPAQIKQWEAGTPTDWANQSHDVAVKIVYGGVPVDGPPPRLGQKYVDRANPVVIEQLQRGGIRLAYILNKCFPTKR